MREGMKVEARYRGKTRYYPGRLARDRGGGKWDIDYDDGEKEFGIDEELIRPLESSGGGGGGGSLREGMKVEARYRGKTRYYPGRLARDRGSGKWDIDYDDGEKEFGIDEELIRPLDDGDAGNGEPSAATYTLQKLAPIDETQFILKACATQFVSLNILVFQLLPFYALGFEWWLEGSAAFLEGIFDLPRLWEDFTLSFAWPSFGYPRLYLPLLVGVLLIGVQLCFMAGKWLLRHGHVFLHLPLVASDAAAWSIERFTIQCLAMLTWRPFSKAADVAKAALETNWRQAKQDLSEARTLKRKPGYKKDWR